MSLKHSTAPRIRFKCPYEKCTSSFLQVKNFVHHHVNQHKATRSVAKEVAGKNGIFLQQIPKKWNASPIKSAESAESTEQDNRTKPPNQIKVIIVEKHGKSKFSDNEDKSSLLGQ